MNTGLNSFLTNFNAYNTGQGNTFNRLASLAGMGQTATGQLGQLGQSSAANIGNLLTGQGNAAAAGTLGSASAINSGLNSIVGGTNSALNMYTNGQLLQLLTGGSGGGGVNLNSFDQTGNFIPAGSWSAGGGATDPYAYTYE